MANKNWMVKLGTLVDTSTIQKQLDKKKVHINTVLKIKINKAEIDKLANDIKRKLNFNNIKINVSGINTALEQVSKNSNKTSTSIQGVGTSIDSTRQSITKLATEQQRLTKADTITKWLQNNSKATSKFGIEIQNMISKLRSSDDLTVPELKKIETQFKKIQIATREAGLLGRSFGDAFRDQTSKFTQWFGVTTIVMSGIHQIRKMTSEVIACDTAMTELKKVSDATTSEIKKYFEDATVTAKTFGATISDVINATADWSRLGYNLPDSKELAKVAVLYKNVGDGIDIASANKSLISTLQGFKLNAEDAMSIIDKFNEVANNMPIDSSGIGEALQRSASSFYAASTDLDKSIALITATNSVVQNPEVVGNMWKTVSMRIRGAKSELEDAGLETDGMVESTSQLRDIIKGMTGFDIMKDENTFKDIYDIIVGIGEEFQNLSDIDQASLLEKLAGKRQGNALAAALNNIDMLKEAYEVSTNSAGSALREQQTYIESIQYSIDRLSASFQKLSNTVIDSSFLKGATESLNSVLNILDFIISKFGMFNALVAGGGIALFVKNFDWLVKSYA